MKPSLASLTASFCTAQVLAGCGGSATQDTGAAGASQCVSGNTNLTTSTTLDGACVYTNSFSISASNVVLNYQGATIDGQGKTNFGLRITSSGKPLSNVTVRNCNFKNQVLQGIGVGWNLPRAEKASKFTHEQIYANSPQYVTIQNTNVKNVAGNGIYIGEYSTYITLDHVTVEGSGKVGLYLDSSTRYTTVKNSTFINNGYVTNREAIAIDASAGNSIISNIFQGNAYGGVLLYKNCQEHHQTNRNSLPRWQHSDNNLIQGNTFINEPVGVWLASRQSRDLRGFDCGDPSYHDGIYFQDYAQNNTISQNKFQNVQIGVTVEDDNNSIIGNDFSGVTGQSIKIGAQFRAVYLNHPVLNTTINTNSGGPTAD